MTFWNTMALVTLNCSLLMERVMSLVVYTQKASWILSSFYLIYLSFSLHIKDIIELGRIEELRFIRLNATC